MWAILGAPAVPVSVHLFARVHVATLRTTRLGEFDFRFRSVQARGPSTLQSGVLYEVGRVTGQGTPAVSGQQLDELCRGTRPWPASRALVPAGKGTGRRLEDPAVQHGKQRPAQAKDSPEIAGAPAFHLPKRIGRSVSTFVRGI